MCATTSKTRLAEDTSPALAKGLRGAREAVECCAGELATVPPESVLETVGKHEKRHSLERMQLQANLLKLAAELERLSTSGKQGVEQDAVLAKLVAARSVSLTAVDLIRESRGMQKSASRAPRASPRRPPAVPVTTKKVVSRSSHNAAKQRSGICGVAQGTGGEGAQGRASAVVDPFVRSLAG